MRLAANHPIPRILWGLIVGVPPLVSLGDEPDFVHQIVPILRENCWKCHTDDKRKADFSIDTEESFRAGSESGPVVEPGDPDRSLLYEVITSDDKVDRMPPKGDPLDEKQIELIRAWITAGAKWEPGFSFRGAAYEPPLHPRNPTLPPAIDGRTNPIDRIIDHYLADKRLARPEPLDDSAFLRRVHLDITGLLPRPDVVTSFLADTSSDKRERLVDSLLADQTAYAGHWMTFWNDLLRNDYSGTGYIDGGRKQISGWLYQALYDNMPYDEFVRQLVAPTPESEGFANGIIWRGSVSAAQVPAMQYAQSVGQTFLGINLKCASCHDSFVDRWKLSDAYGLAAIYSDKPIEMARCDKPLGETAVAAWLFPELGTVDNDLPREQRLDQLAGLITKPENGRTPRVIVNRLWQRLMGRGIVHPVDAMQTAPWSEDLLDMLGFHLASRQYDLKQTLRLICLSQAYQSKAESFEEAPQETNYVYQGPRPKRLTAEEFTDAIWQICDTAPAGFDAPVERAPVSEAPALSGTPSWIWSDTEPVPAGKIVTFRTRFTLAEVPEQAFAVMSADNSFQLWVNGRTALSGDTWQEPESTSLAEFLIKGGNELLMVVKNEGSGMNPAGAVFHAMLKRGDQWEEIVSDASWQWSLKTPGRDGRMPHTRTDWQPAAVIEPNPWNAVTAVIPDQLRSMQSGNVMVRASLLNADPLMRTLGRPNREQIVSTRPNDLTTLEAMDLNNGGILDERLAEGARSLLAMGFSSSREMAIHVWQAAFSRNPTASELNLILLLLGEKPDPGVTQDFLWSVLMMPEFQIIR